MPLSHGVPSATATAAHPPGSLHNAARHGSLGWGHAGGSATTTHSPAWQPRLGPHAPDSNALQSASAWHWQVLVPLTQLPSVHVSPWLQGFPSLHGAPAGALMRAHPLTGSQAVTSHDSPCGQTTAGPPAHAPSRQLSPVVQALPSSHGVPLGSVAQSPQMFDPLVHTPAAHVSALVQGSPSSQLAPSGCCAIPHTEFVQIAISHAVSGAGQSLAVTQPPETSTFPPSVSGPPTSASLPSGLLPPSPLPPSGRLTPVSATPWVSPPVVPSGHAANAIHASRAPHLRIAQMFM